MYTPATKLTFMIPGFSKCGTTTLCSLLNEHPDIFIPAIKEPNFFVTKHYPSQWPWYEDFFKGSESCKAVGEGSTFYSSEKSEKIARDRMLSYYPDLKFIFIARNPFKRIESSFREFHDSGYKFNVHIPYSLHEALLERKDILDDTNYWDRINNYRDKVPDNRIHVMFLEDLSTDPEAELKKCFEFLDVAPEYKVQTIQKQLNSGGGKSYDTPLMRKIRQHPRWQKRWSSLSHQRQSRIQKLLRLRKPFNKKLTWEDSSRACVINKIGAGTQEFLAFYGKPVDFWDDLNA